MILSILLAAATSPVEIKDCASCPTMMVLPGGRFSMGSDPAERQREGVEPEFGNRESPRHQVTIAHRFAISRDEITRGQYATFVAATHRPEPPSCATYRPGGDGVHIRQSWADLPGKSWRDPGFPQTDDHPVVCVNIHDATDYAAWLSRMTGHVYRLPSEAEWEYAARGGTTSARWWGDQVKPLCSMANVMTSGTETAIGWPAYEKGKLVCASDAAWTVPVGSFPANPFGLRDVFGNAWEWVADCRHSNYVGAPIDGRAWVEPGCSRGFSRGGAFHSEFHFARAASRLWVDGGFGSGEARSGMNGIRLVREV